MQTLIFIAYLALFTWLVTRTAFFRKTGSSPSVLAGLFLLHVATACVYGYVHSFPPDHLRTIDTWRFHQQSLRELDRLRAHPLSFFGELFQDQYHSGFRRLFSTSGSYWNDLKNNVMVKLVTLFNLFSFGNYYTNLIFFNYIVLFGPVALYRFLKESLGRQDLLLSILVFGTPSILFWGSGLHKEGLLFAAITLLLFHARGLIHARAGAGSMFTILLAIGAIFVLRNNVLFALAPAAIAWCWAERRGRKAWPIFLVVNLVSIILFFATPLIIPRIDPPMTMHLRQKSFIALGGRTALPVDELRPDLSGFLHNLPSAANITFLHPLPGEGGLFYLPFTAELILLYLLLVLFLIFPERSMRGKPVILFSFNFAILLFLLIGYCVPNVGAIIRYRSLGMPFLFIAVALGTDWKRVRSIFSTRYK